MDPLSDHSRRLVGTSTGALVGCSLVVFFLILVGIACCLGIFDASNRHPPTVDDGLDVNDDDRDLDLNKVELPVEDDHYTVPELAKTASNESSHDSLMEEEEFEIRTCCDVHTCSSGSCAVCDKTKPGTTFLIVRDNPIWNLSGDLPAKWWDKTRGESEIADGDN
jgi:hypothetical protein